MFDLIRNVCAYGYHSFMEAYWASELKMIDRKIAQNKAIIVAADRKIAARAHA